MLCVSGDLESQIQDLHEANESADNKLSAAQTKIQKLEQFLKDTKAEVKNKFGELSTKRLSFSSFTFTENVSL